MIIVEMAKQLFDIISILLGFFLCEAPKKKSRWKRLAFFQRIMNEYTNSTIKKPSELNESEKKATNLNKSFKLASKEQLFTVKFEFSNKI